MYNLISSSIYQRKVQGLTLPIFFDICYINMNRAVSECTVSMTSSTIDYDVDVANDYAKFDSVFEQIKNDATCDKVQLFKDYETTTNIVISNLLHGEIQGTAVIYCDHVITRPLRERASRLMHNIVTIGSYLEDINAL